MNTYENYITDALEMVSAWEIEETDLADAVNDQAKLMAGLGFEPNYLRHHDNPYIPLHF